MATSRKLTIAASVMLAFLLLFSYSVSAANNKPGLPSNAYNELGADFQFYNTNSGFEPSTIGGMSSQTPILFRTFIPDNAIDPPLIGIMNGTKPYPMIIQHSTGDVFRVWIWNSTTKNIQLLTSVSVATLSPTMTTSGIYEFAGDTVAVYPIITSAKNIRLYNLDERFSLRCTTPTYSSDQITDVSSVLYDHDYNVLIWFTGGANNNNAQIRLFDSNCQSVKNLSFSAPATQYWSKRQKPAIADLYHDGSTHQLIAHSFSTSWPYPATLIVESFNLTDIKAESRFSGSDGIFGSYSCTNGVCQGFSDTQKISDAVLFPSDERLAFAVEDLTTVGGSNYKMRLLDNFGDMIWDSDDKQISIQCGEFSSIRNVTFFQPILADNPDSSTHNPDLLFSKSAVCGACQPDCKYNGTLTKCDEIILDCLDYTTGNALSSTTISIGRKYEAERPGLPSPADRKMNMMSFNNIDDTTDLGEILFRDNILTIFSGNNAQSSFVSGAHSTNDVLIPYGSRLERFEDDYVFNNGFYITWTNTSTRIYYKDYINKLPQYTWDTYKTSPTNNKSMCLNFSRDNGLRIRYQAVDNESNDIYIKQDCDINRKDATFYNYTDYYFCNTGSCTTEIICRYNQTGQVTFKTYLSDFPHLYGNLTGINETSFSKTYSIIDSVPPFCNNDYSSSDTDNPSTTPGANNTDEFLLNKYNISANQTLSGSVEQTLIDFKIVTEKDKAIFGLLLILLVTMVMIGAGFYIAAKGHFMLPSGYFIAIGIVDFILFLIGTFLGLFSVWFLVFISFILAIGGAMVLLRIIRGNQIQGT